MAWLKETKSLTEREACSQISVDEFPSQCGECAPSRNSAVPAQPAYDPCSQFGKTCTLVLDEQFDGAELDSTRWNVEVRNDGSLRDGRPDEAQFYVRDGVEVAAGRLNLKLFHDSSLQAAEGIRCNAIAFEQRPLVWSNGRWSRDPQVSAVCAESNLRQPTGFFSGRVNTFGKIHFRYGVIEARLRLASHNQYSWSSLWLLGTDIETVGWPFCGEAALAEMWTSDTSWSKPNGVGHAFRPAFGLHTALRLPVTASTNGFEGVQSQGLNLNWTAFNDGAYPQRIITDPVGYNTYRFERTSKRIAWFVNDQPVAKAIGVNGQLRLFRHDGYSWASAGGKGLWPLVAEKEFFVVFNLAFASVSTHLFPNLTAHKKDGMLDSASLEYIKIWDL